MSARIKSAFKNPETFGECLQALFQDGDEIDAQAGAFVLARCIHAMVGIGVKK